jgi:hypothetical protein
MAAELLAECHALEVEGILRVAVGESVIKC